MEMVFSEKDLIAAGAEVLTDGRRGLRIRGWEMVSCKDSILNSFHLQLWEEQLQTSHLTEMVFGNSYLILKHVPSGTKSHFNASDALTSWKLEGLPPVKVPAAAKVEVQKKDYPVDAAACNDPSIISLRLPIMMHKTQKLKLGGNQ